MNIDQISEVVGSLCEDIEQSATRIAARAVRLDTRCGMILIGEDFVATYEPRLLDYYGGFEYVENNVLMLNGMKIYPAGENPRVQAVLEAFSTLS